VEASPLLAHSAFLFTFHHGCHDELPIGVNVLLPLPGEGFQAVFFTPSTPDLTKLEALLNPLSRAPFFFVKRKEQCRCPEFCMYTWRSPSWNIGTPLSFSVQEGSAGFEVIRLLLSFPLLLWAVRGFVFQATCPEGLSFSSSGSTFSSLPFEATGEPFLQLVPDLSFSLRADSPHRIA